MRNTFTEIAIGLKSLFTGMRITLGEFFKPSVTLQYPHEALKMTPRFRGHIELVRDPVTGRALCFACKVCEKACPSDCISVDGAKLDGEKRKSVTQFMLDFTKCSLCGSCVEACKHGALRFSKEYNLAGLSKEQFIMDLFKRLEAERIAAEAAAPAKPEVLSAAQSPQPEGQKTPGDGAVGHRALPERPQDAVGHGAVPESSQAPVVTMEVK